jgi:hypothetical protein
MVLYLEIEEETKYLLKWFNSVGSIS